MKKSTLLILLLIVCLFNQAFAQGPTLNLVGGSPSVAKGNINTEVLSQVIQKKQEEVKQFVFRNTIIEHFNNPDNNFYTHLNNYATYNYIYNLMDVITSGKNKTAVTKSIIQNTAEFGYVYGVVLYIQKDLLIRKDAIEVGKYRIGPLTTEQAKVTDHQPNKKSNLNDAGTPPADEPTDTRQLTLAIPPDIKNFNFFIDACYDILIKHPELHPDFKFNVDTQSINFKTWYENDNVYRKEYNAANDSMKQEYQKFQAKLIAKITDLNKIIQGFKYLQDTLKRYADSVSNKNIIQIKNIVEAAIDNNQTAITTGLNFLYDKKIVDTAQIGSLVSFVNRLNSKANAILPLVQFYSDLKKSEFKDFSLTKDQYYAMKFLTIDFLKIARNNFKNDVVATVIDFLLENTLVEYADASSTLQTAEKEAQNAKGYLYVDIEALVSQIYQRFHPTDRSGKYFSVFLTLGLNEGSFLHTNNTLGVDAQGLPKSISNLYYASEKIGFKYKIANQRYTRSFGPGEQYTYYTNKLRSWRRPMPKTLISDYYISVYGSGILYNIVNTKSDDKFKYALVGSSIGITFFNGLSLSAGLACPYTDKQFKAQNLFVNFGIDIPIIDYISALTK